MNKISCRYFVLRCIIHTLWGIPMLRTVSQSICFCNCMFTRYGWLSALNSQRRPPQLPLRISNHSHVRRVSRRNTKGNLRTPLANANMRALSHPHRCLLANYNIALCNYFNEQLLQYTVKIQNQHIFYTN